MKGTTIMYATFDANTLILLGGLEEKISQYMNLVHSDQRPITTVLFTTSDPLMDAHQPIAPTKHGKS